MQHRAAICNSSVLFLLLLAGCGFTQPTGPAPALVFPSPTPRVPATGTPTASPTPTAITRSFAIQGQADAVAWSPDGKQLATMAGMQNGAFQVWDVSTGKQIASYGGQLTFPRCLAWSPDGRRIASGSKSPSGVVEDHPVQVWDAFTGQHPFYYTGQSNVAALAWSPNGAEIASAGGASVKIWQPPAN